MEQKLYTKGHDLGLLRSLGNPEQKPTAQEYAYLFENEFSGKFESKEKLLNWFLSSKAQKKLSEISFLIEYINKKGYKNILSLGSGISVFEYLLKRGLNADVKVVVTDFNPYLVGQAKKLFPEISPHVFDFCNGDVGKFQADLGVKFDLAICLGSTFVMEKEDFIKFLRGLNNSGIKEVMDFYGAYIDFNYFFRNVVLLSIKESNLVRKVFGKPALKKDFIGKFHGFARSRGNLRRIYKQGGYRIAKEFYQSSYNYAAILSAR